MRVSPLVRRDVTAWYCLVDGKSFDRGPDAGQAVDVVVRSPSPVRVAVGGVSLTAVYIRQTEVQAVVFVAVGLPLVEVSGDGVSLCFVAAWHTRLLGRSFNRVISRLPYEVGTLVEFAVQVMPFGVFQDLDGTGHGGTPGRVIAVWQWRIVPLTAVGYRNAHGQFAALSVRWSRNSANFRVDGCGSVALATGRRCHSDDRVFVPAV